VHQFGIIKKCIDTVDARYKHEDKQLPVSQEGLCDMVVVM